jgi:hypothetical protein
MFAQGVQLARSSAHLHQAGLLDRHHVEALVSGEAEQKPEEVVA